MSDRDQSNGDVDPWGSSENVAEASSSSSVDHSGDTSDSPYVENQDKDSTHVEDVLANEPRKKSKIIFVLIGVVLAALSAVGSIGYSFYKKLHPVEQLEAQHAALDGLPASAAEPKALDSLPIGNGSTAADKAADAATEAAALVTPAAVAPSVMPVAPATAAVSPVAVTPPTAPVPPAVKTAEPAPAPAVTCVPPPAAEKPHRKVRSLAATAVDKPVVAKVAKKASTAEATAKVSKATPDRAEPEEAPVAKDSSFVLNYKILAIEPRHGDHQQAWIRDPQGKISILRAGDSIDGVRVVSVNFADGVVRTSQGTLRK